MQIKHEWNVNFDSRSRSVGFWEPWYLSNVYLSKSPFYIEADRLPASLGLTGEILVSSVEEAYQRIKFSSQPEVLARLEKLSDPAKIADEAHRHKATISNWEDIKFQVMEAVIRAKVEQDPIVKRVLLLSQGWFLYEDIPSDSPDDYWGLRKGEGFNANGKILMKIRLEYLLASRFEDMQYRFGGREVMDYFAKLAHALQIDSTRSDFILDVFERLIDLRARTLGITEDDVPYPHEMSQLAPFEQLAAIEHRYLQEVRDVLDVPDEMSDTDTWAQAAVQFDRDATKESLAVLLQLNKFTTTYDDIVRELNTLGLPIPSFLYGEEA